MTLEQYLLTGSYVFTAGAYVMGWKILQALNRIEQALARGQGLMDGQEHERRITRLERN